VEANLRVLLHIGCQKEGFAVIEQWLQVAVDLKICAGPSNTYNRSKNSQLCQITLLEISKSKYAKDLIENLSLSLSLSLSP
jgi:hypothetical protein